MWISQALARIIMHPFSNSRADDLHSHGGGGGLQKQPTKKAASPLCTSQQVNKDTYKTSPQKTPL